MNTRSTRFFAVIRGTFIVVLWLGAGQLYGAHPPSQIVFHRFLRYSDTYLPKDLLATKTVVVVHTPTDPVTGKLTPWKEFAEEAHGYMRSIGVDVVKYYHMSEITAGHDVRRAIAVELAEREITNLVLLAFVPEQDQFILIATLFSGDVEFVQHDQDAWYSTASNLNYLFRQFARTIDEQDLARENLLIIDVPEYLRRPGIIRGRRNAMFNTDLRIDRLAVPLFDSIPIPGNMPPGEINGYFAEDIVRLNSINARRNTELEMIFSRYTYGHGFVRYTFDEQSYRNQNYQFIVMMLHGTARTVRAYLDYPAEDAEATVSVYTDQSGTTREVTLSPEQLVYKVYIKHIYTGDVYLGDVWDAAPSWQEALQNHLNRMLLRLK